MERQKLMGDYEGRKTKVNRNEYSEPKNVGRSDRNYSSIESSSSFLDARRQVYQKRDRSSIMNVFSDIFGGKTTRKENSFAVSLMMTMCLVLSVLLCYCSVVDSTPVTAPRHPIFSLSPSARNIRHLPCVSRRTKEEGICMFAIDCLKSNGTHLGTCIDRFYFGSCCQIPDPLIQITDNNIEDNAIFGPAFHKPSIVKGDQDDKIDNSLNALSNVPTSTISSSHKTELTPSIKDHTQKPTEASHKPSLSSQTPPKPYASSLKPMTRKPEPQTQKPSGSSTGKPISSSQTPSSSSQKPVEGETNDDEGIKKTQATTQKVRPTVTQATKRPNLSTGVNNVYLTKKPITTGVVVNNTIYTGEKKPLDKIKPTIVNETVEKLPELMPSIKPLRNKTISTTAASSSTTNRPVSSKYTTTTTKPVSTTNRLPTTFLMSKRNTTRPVLSEITKVTLKDSDVTTEFPYKISTFQSVQGVQSSIKPTSQRPTLGNIRPAMTTLQEIIRPSTQAPTTERPESVKPYVTRKPATPENVKPLVTNKPTPQNVRPFITNKPETPDDFDPQLPFGTRLPSSTVEPIRPSSSSNDRPTSPSIQTTPTRSPPMTAFSVSSTTTNPPTQKPFQKPKPSFKPERPIQRPIQNISSTSRPLVQRPQNSTLSNRRTTTTQRPTTVFKRPTSPPKIVNTTYSEPTKKPTTIIYRPSVETRPSLKPTYVNQKPSSSAQRPTTSVISTTSSYPVRRPTVSTTQKPTKISVNTTSPKPTAATEKPSYSTKEPLIVKSTTEFTSQKITTIASTISETSTVKTSSRPVSVTPASKPTSAATPTSPTTPPAVKPSSSYVPSRPSPKPAVPSTRKPISNEVNDSSSQKPIVSSTEKLGLVTWTNYLEPAVTPGSVTNTTLKEEDWSPVTPPDGWVLLQTVSSVNISIPTMEPSHTITPPKKPGVSSKPSTSKPVFQTPTRVPITPAATQQTKKPTTVNETTTEATTTVQSTTIKNTTVEDATKTPLETTTKKVTAETTTKASQAATTTKGPVTQSATTVPSTEKPVFTIHVTTKPLVRPGNVTERPSEEFSTFMSVSGGPTTAGPNNSSSVTVANMTSSENVSNVTVSATTEMYGNGSSVTSGSTTSSNGTLVQEETTQKSTVSPIEGITSTAAPASETSVSIDSLNMSDYRDVCGRRLWPEARVVGGSRAKFGNWPWQVSLRQWRTSTYLHKCGAALLSENWAVTAAHCVDSVPPSDLLLRLGEHDLASEDEPYGFQERRVQIVASHPQFDSRTFEYDLALLRFYEPVTFQPNILPVCVPTNDEGFVGKTAYVTGWGRLYEDGPLPSVLQQVSVPVLENEACEQMYRAAGYIEHIPHIFICAGWRKGGFDSCEGDSGGPMVLQREDKRFLLAGIISWGIGCAEPNQPGVYTRISEFREWINQILQF